jgi:hypothetical protein
VVREFIAASQTVNASSDQFAADFSEGQAALTEAAAVARSERDIAKSQLVGIEATVRELQALNEAAQQTNSNILSVDEATRNVDAAMGDLGTAMARVEGANAEVEAATSRVESATAGVADATRGVEAATLATAGGVSEVESATRAVEEAVIALGNAILQGFGNLAISDAQIRNFLQANPQLSPQEIIDIAIQNGVSGSQVARATGAPIEQINRFTGGRTVPTSSIGDFVLQNLNDPLSIYQAAVQNGITSARLAEDSILTRAQIEAFVRDSGLAPFERGSDFIPRTGIAMLHKGEAVVPSSTTGEVKALREEVRALREDQNQQTAAMLDNIMQAAKDNALMIIRATKELTDISNFQRRSAPVTR